MLQLLVTAEKLNKRKFVPTKLPDNSSISGIVIKGTTFIGEEVKVLPNPSLGKWFRDRDNGFYWGGGLSIISDIPDNIENEGPDNNSMESISITPLLKRKIEQVVNVFETSSLTGKYEKMVKLRDYTNPLTKLLEIQITYGRSQTTEFGHLKALIADYVACKGKFADVFSGYLNRIGKNPSLANDEIFCSTLVKAGKEDPIMKSCQDNLFELKYFQPAFNWFTTNGFKLPLSLLVIYDSTIHSGSIPKFLRKRFETVLPVSGGNEKEWIENYIDVREKWLANHSNTILRSTVYRTTCFNEQIKNNNWLLTERITANGIIVA